MSKNKQRPKLKLEKPVSQAPVPPEQQDPKQRVPDIESIKSFFGFDSCILIARKQDNIITWMSQMSTIEALGTMNLAKETVTGRNTQVAPVGSPPFVKPQ